MSGYLKNLARRSLAAPSLHSEMRLPFNGVSGFEPAVSLEDGAETRAVEERKALRESPVKAGAEVPVESGRKERAGKADPEAPGNPSRPQSPNFHERISGRAYPALLPPLPEKDSKSQEPPGPVETQKREETPSPEGAAPLPGEPGPVSVEREFKPLVKTVRSPKPAFSAPSPAAAGTLKGPQARETQSLPDIHVSIGRIEVSAVAAAPAPKRAPDNGVKIMSLQEYEERRRGRSR